MLNIFLAMSCQHEEMLLQRQNRGTGRGARQEANQDASRTYQRQLDDLIADEEPETIIALYAGQLIQKF